MKKEIYIQIPEPCHEDWNKMTPVDQGKYCQSCCKEVVDFSVMTDQEIISFISKPRGKTCGNFAGDQLNRIITEPAVPAKKKFWVVMLSFLLPLAISFKGKAQFRKKKSVDTTQTSTVHEPDKPTRGKVAVTKCKVESMTQLRGDTIVVDEAQKSYEIVGTVTDEKGNRLEGATVSILNTKARTATNSVGTFRISARANVSLSISYVGFETSNLQITSSSLNQPIAIALKPIANELVGMVGLISFETYNDRIDYPEPMSINFTGNILDTSGNPIASASIELIGTSKGTAANPTGEFNLYVAKERKLKLRISALGFETKEITLTSKEAKQKQNFILTPQPKILEEVVITALPTISCYRLGGAVSVVRREDIKAVIVDTIVNLIKPSKIKIYPNPVTKNSFVKVKLSEKGIYQLSLIDNEGKVIQQNKFTISSKNMAYQLELPASITAGMYYLKVVEEKTHKQYTQKLVVQ